MKIEEAAYATSEPTLLGKVGLAMIESGVWAPRLSTFTTKAPDMVELIPKVVAHMRSLHSMLGFQGGLSVQELVSYFEELPLWHTKALDDTLNAADQFGHGKVIMVVKSYIKELEKPPKDIVPEVWQ